MRAAAQRLVWIIGLICLASGVAGVLAFSPVTIALSITGWFLACASIRSLAEHADVHAASPDLQYWARKTLLRTIGLMIMGTAIAATAVSLDFSLHLSWHAQALLTLLMICAMIVVSRIAIPSVFAASWEIHGVRERRRRERSTTVVSRVLVRVVSLMIVITSLVGSFAFLHALKSAASQYSRVSAMARDVSSSAPSVLEELFSPSSTTTR